MRGCRSLLLALLLVAAPGLRAEEIQPPSVEAGVEETRNPRSHDDPWEGMNRKTFAFNEGVDRYFLEPVATGWDWLLPKRVQRSIGNFYQNTLQPVRFANELLQAKPRAAYETAWRLAINSTVGIGGLFDPASSWNVAKSDEDFGQTLGRWGTPPGPYLVLPVLGPSSPRDASGRVVDSLGYVATYFVPFYVGVSAAAVDAVNARAGALETIRAERKAAFDFYTAVRSAYLQYRENRVRDRAAAPVEEEAGEDLYYFDEDE